MDMPRMHTKSATRIALPPPGEEVEIVSKKVAAAGGRLACLLAAVDHGTVVSVVIMGDATRLIPRFQCPDSTLHTAAIHR